MMQNFQTILVTGGAGYVGSVLVPKLLKQDFKVKVLDLYLYEKNLPEMEFSHPNLIKIKDDLRNTKLLDEIIPGCDAIIHLACISNDPSFELNPKSLVATAILLYASPRTAILDLTKRAPKARS